MSGNKSKRKKHQHTPEHEHPKADNKLDNKPGRVTVSGKLEADFPPNLVEKYDAANEKQEARDSKRFKVEIVTVVLLFAYTTIAFWQGCSTKKSADAAKSAADTAADSLVLAERPWITISKCLLPAEPAVTTTAEETKKIILTCWIQNTGKTPALNESSASNILFVTGMHPGMRLIMNPEQPSPSVSIVPPDAQGMHFAAGFRPGTTNLPVETLNEYKAGVSALYLLARIDYSDVFGKAHWTTACLYHPYGTDLGTWNSCPTGNDVDH